MINQLRTIGMIVVLAVLPGACGKTASTPDKPMPGSSDSKTSLQGSGERDSLAMLIERLGGLPGTFERDAVTGTLRFEGGTELFVAIADFGHDAVARLVDCLDSGERSIAVFQATPVPRGAMCYEALRVTAYHEATDEHGDVAPGWPGYIQAPTLVELRAAKAAWQDVVRRKAYTLS